MSGPLHPKDRNSQRRPSREAHSYQIPSPPPSSWSECFDKKSDRKPDMSKRERRRITVEVDLTSLGFKELRAVTQALAALEELGKRGIIKFSVTGVNAPAKRRSDAGRRKTTSLQPQTKIVLDFLESQPNKEFTAKEIAEATQVNGEGINGQLHALLKRGLVACRKAERNLSGRGPKAINLWKTTKHNNVVPMLA